MKLLDDARTNWGGRLWVGAVLVMLLVGMAWTPVSASDPETTAGTPAADQGMPSYGKDFMERLAGLPMQEGGRIKPFSSWAGYSLLQINGKRSVQISDDVKMDAMNWAVEALFFREIAVTRNVFLIEDDQVLADLGLNVIDKETKKKKRKRDRYSYDDLRGAIELLRAKVGKIHQQLESRAIRSLDLTPVQHQEMALSASLSLFEHIIGAMDPIRQQVDVSLLAKEPQWFDGRAETSLALAFARLPDINREMLKRNEGLKEGDEKPPATVAMTRTAVDIQSALRRLNTKALIFSVFPPKAQPEKFDQWLTPSHMGVPEFDTMRWPAMEGARALYEPVRSAMVAQVGHLAAAFEHRQDVAKFEQHMDALRDLTSAVAERRGEFDRVDSEVAYYKFEPFFKAQIFFLLGFLLLAITWFLTDSKWMYRLAVVIVGIALILVITGITWRSYLRRLAPVSNLYDTIPFITAAGVLACLITEWINKRRVAIVLGAVLGALGMWLEARYQYVDRKDTMRPLEAVLRTNFWLSTHVTTVTIGYAAGLLAGAFAHVHVLGRIFGFKSHDRAFYRSLAKMIYGTVCFGLLFSVVGTILGGIWANDSWGRFWGWDPKENGALMICLWEVAILHARMGGFIKGHGIAMAGVMTTPIVAFSWWGVNTLGVGLHQYGYIDGVRTNLYIFYWFEFSVLLAGGVWWLVNRPGAKPTTST